MHAHRSFLASLPLVLLLFLLTPVARSATTPPIVTLTAPPRAAIYTLGDPIFLEAAVLAADNAVVRVEFYADDALLGADAEAPWQFYWTGVPVGAHKVMAVAIDTAGNRTESPVVELAVLRQQTAAEPYPPSPLILGLQWAPVATIEQFGQDSDNWTLTWADDNRLYTGYGDGRGWEPKIEKKVSMGYVAIDGAPGNIRGVNVRSPDEQPYGAGAEGIKASGMLMVDGVLYMWARNVAARGQGCQLAWSTDHAQHWQWSDWLFPNFGYCAFVNFGQNYSGARDEYVYMVTPDGPSAYIAYPNFVLTRVPKNQILNRSAYEFFQQRDAQNNPIWTADITQRGAVFTTVGKKAGRSSMTYSGAGALYLVAGHQ
ncbi:MAG: Ig-like domain-containing protein [Caldilineaceae bacterium]